MPHTLHPEIKSKLLNIITIMDGQFRSGNMQTSEKTRLWDILMDKLWPYLLPPSQHLKDDGLCEYCKWTGKLTYWYLTNPVRKNGFDCPCTWRPRKSNLSKEEIKQSTPKIERIDRVTKHEIDASTIHKRVKTKDIEATIQLILDKINSLDQ